MLPAQELFLFGVNRENGSGVYRVRLLQNRFTLAVANEVPLLVDFFHPVFQINSNATGHVDCGKENRRDAVCACNDWSNVNEWNVRTCLLADPKGHVVYPRHPG